MKKLVKFLVAAVFAVAIFAVSSVETADAYTVTDRSKTNLALKTTVNTYGGYTWDTAEKQAMYPEVPKSLFAYYTRTSRGLQVAGYEEDAIYLSRKADASISTMAVMLDKEITTWDEAIKFADLLKVYGSDGKLILCHLEQEPNTGRFGLRAFGSSINAFTNYAYWDVESGVYGNSVLSRFFVEGYWPHLTYDVSTSDFVTSFTLNGKHYSVLDNLRADYMKIENVDKENVWGAASVIHAKAGYDSASAKLFFEKWPALYFDHFDLYLNVKFNGQTKKIYLDTYNVNRNGVVSVK